MRFREAWMRSRTALRLVLGTELQCDPAAVLIHEGGGVKPSVSDIEFNLSHSGEWAAIATCQEVPVGIDIERVCLDFPWQSIAERFLPSQGIDSVQGFFECWTRQEAYLKGIGEGLVGGLDVVPDSAWSVQPCLAPPGYAAALAVRSRDYVVSSHSLW
jgi:4'-phosphopantetheinyl transferase